jgi:hypothetical protein
VATSPSPSPNNALSLDAEFDQHLPIPWFNRLWAAVIRRAAVDWVLYRGHESSKLRRLGEEAEEWLFRGPDEPQEDPGIFASVCQSLNMDMEDLRDRVRSITEADARRLRGLEFDDEDL